MAQFLFSKNTIFFSILLTNVLHCMDSMPKNALSESELKKVWEVLKHPGNNLVPPLEIQNKIAQEMVRNISLNWPNPAYTIDSNIGTYTDVFFTSDKTEILTLCHVGYDTRFTIVRNAETGRFVDIFDDHCNHFVKDKNRRSAWKIKKKEFNQDFFGKLSEDENKYVRMKDDFSLELLDTHNWTVLHTLNGNELRKKRFGLARFLCHPSGKQILLIGGAGAFGVWNIATGTFMHMYVPNSFGIPSEALSHNGNMCAIADFFGVGIFDTQDWHKIKDVGRNSISKVIFSHDDRLLFTQGKNTAKVWDTQTWKLIFQTQREPWGMTQKSAAFTKDDKFLVLQSSMRSISIWSTENWQCIKELSFDEEKTIIKDVEISGNKLVVLFMNGALKIYDIIDQKTQYWLKTNLLPEQARIIARAHESSEKGKQLVLIKQSAIDIFNTFPDHVKQYLVNRFRILIELRGSRRSERLRNKKRKRDDILGGQPKSRKLNQEDEK